MRRRRRLIQDTGGECPTTRGARNVADVASHVTRHVPLRAYMWRVTFHCVYVCHMTCHVLLHVCHVPCNVLLRVYHVSLCSVCHMTCHVSLCVFHVPLRARHVTCHVALCVYACVRVI